jgi:hypothetical protein
MVGAWMKLKVSIIYSRRAEFISASHRTGRSFAQRDCSASGVLKQVQHDVILMLL